MWVLLPAPAELLFTSCAACAEFQFCIRWFDAGPPVLPFRVGSPRFIAFQIFLISSTSLKAFLSVCTLPVLGLSTYFSFLLWCSSVLSLGAPVELGLEMIQINCFAQVTRGAVTSPTWSFLSHPLSCFFFYSVV